MDREITAKANEMVNRGVFYFGGELVFDLKNKSKRHNEAKSVQVGSKGRQQADGTKTL